MKIKSSFLFACRMLFPKTGKKSSARRSLFGGFLCIAISIIPLVMVIAVSNGMIEGMTERMIGLSSGDLCCILHPDVKEASSAEELVALGEKLVLSEGVDDFYPELQGVGLAASEKYRTGAQIRAVENDIFKKNPAFSRLFEVVESERQISSVDELLLEDGKNAVIGSRLAELLGVHAGDSIRLITTRRLPKGKVIPKITKFKISGIVSSGYQELDALWFFISLNTGYSILPLTSSQIMLCLDTPDPFSLELDKTASSLETLVPSFTRIYKWNELNAAQYENFSSTKMMLTFIMLLIVLVASVNISSALIMLVMERRKEIAVLKSYGASNSGIALSFLITGFVTGGLGVFTGIPLGLLCAVNFDKILSGIENILTLGKKLIFALSGKNPMEALPFHLLDPAYYLQNADISIPLDQLVIIALGTLVLSLATSTVPAIKAGEEKPIDILRKGNL